jgi:hypothetical protein
VPVTVTGGTVKIKIAHRDGLVVQATPEYDDVARLARDTDRPVRAVLAEAVAAAEAAGLRWGAAVPQAADNGQADNGQADNGHADNEQADSHVDAGPDHSPDHGHPHTHDHPHDHLHDHAHDHAHDHLHDHPHDDVHVAGHQH